MGLHLDATIKAIDKALAEAKKIEREYKAAKNDTEKAKLKKMAEAAKKIAEAHFNSIDAAKAKDRQEMLTTFKSMGL